MLKIFTALCMLSIAIPSVAYAACSAEDAMNKSSEVSDVLSNKLSSNADGSRPSAC